MSCALHVGARCGGVHTCSTIAAGLFYLTSRKLSERILNTSIEGDLAVEHPCAGVLGMTLLSKMDFPTMKFTLYFVAYTPSPSDVPEDPQDRIEATFGRCASL